MCLQLEGVWLGRVQMCPVQNEMETDASDTGHAFTRCHFRHQNEHTFGSVATNRWDDACMSPHDTDMCVLYS